MKLKIWTLLLIILSSSAITSAQQKANYQLAEKFRQFSLGKPLSKMSLTITPNPINDSDRFWFDFTTSEGTKYYFVDPDKREKSLLFNNADIAEGISLITRDVISPFDLKISDIKFSKDLSSITFERRGKKYEYNRKSKKVSAIEEEEKQADDDIIFSWMNFSPDEKYIMYAKNHNLYIKGNKKMGIDTTEIQLTTDGERYYSFARNSENDEKEKEVATNARWCKDSRHIYIIREDTRKLKDMWVINSLTKRPTLKTYRYEMPGEKNLTQFELWIGDIEKKKLEKVNIEKWPDQYIMPLADTKKGEIFFERTKRTWDEVDICSVNTSTLKVKEIIHEEDKPYRDPHARSVAILNDGKDILFRSERTGWGHYYHYDGDGNLKNTITSGQWVSGQIAEIDTLARTIYLYGYGKEKGINPYYYMLYKANIDKEGVTPLSTEDGQHNARFLKSKKYYIDTYSRVDKEPTIVLKDNNGKVILELAKPDLKPVYEAGWRKPERFTVKAADGITDLYGVMWKPADFDSTKCYPIISCVYPGPYFEFVPTAFILDNSYCTRIAQLGFIVITVGHRGGSPMRGKVYHRFGYGNMRDYPLADDKAAIEQLAQKYPFINGKKVGIYGHSGGGFMAAAAICTYPDFYTAAVSCSGNHDNNIYNRGWAECYHGVKETVKTVKDSTGVEHKDYSYSCKIPTNMEIAKNLKGHLLLVTGDMDHNVHPANTYRMVDALIKAGKNFDLIVLPGSGHGYSGDSEKFFEHKMWNYFAKYLLHDDRSDSWGEINDCTKE